jgi:hypothetical protein
MSGILRSISSGARLFNPRGSCPLELVDEGRERAFDDCGGITIGNDVTQEILRALEVVVRFQAHGDLDQVALWRKRRDRRARD